MLSVRQNFRTKFGASPPNADHNAIKENPLGLLIVLNKTGRRKQSTGMNPLADGNRSDDNEHSAFSYSSDTDDMDDEEHDLNEDRRAYFSELNDEFAYALSLENKKYHFEPCRRMRATSESQKRKKKDETRRTGGKKNLYKRPGDQARNVKEGSPRKTSAPESARPKVHFWASSSSWSAIGRFFGKFKHTQQHEDEERHRRLSLQTPPTPDTDDGSDSLGEYRFRNSSYDDPAAFVQKVEKELMSGEMGQIGDVSVSNFLVWRSYGCGPQYCLLVTA